MIFCLYGGNSYQALRKMREFKAAFSKKSGGFLIEEIDGDAETVTPEDFRAALGQANLFSKTRLVIFRNILNANPAILKILKENGDFVKDSKDVFIFWEKEPEKPALSFFKKYAEKTQEMKTLDKVRLDAWLVKKAQSLGVKLGKDERTLMIEEAAPPAGGGAEWALENELEKIVLGSGQRLRERLTLPRKASGGSDTHRASAAPSPFGFVEKIFSAPFGRALLALKEAEVGGQDLQRLIYPLLWKAKQKKMPDAYFAGILAESAMRRDPKNSYEILERFIFSLRA